MNILPVFPSGESKLLGTTEHPWDEAHVKKYYDEKGNDLPIILTGMIIPFAGNAGGVPVGYLLCDGSAVSRTDYSELFEVIGTTYGVGDGSTTFNLPNTIGRFAEGAATSGSYKSAGLPNITGQILAFASTDIGAFRTGDVYSHAKSSTSEHLITINTFDASRVSSIYGNSDTVQPNSFTVQYIVKY